MSADNVFNLPALKDGLLFAELAKLRILRLLRLADAYHARADYPSEEEFRTWISSALIARSEFACAQEIMTAAAEALQNAKKEIYP